MSKFRVYLATVASTIIEVEAEDGEQAIEKAFESSLPHTPAFSDFDLGDWSLPSELFPAFNYPEDDYEELP